MRLHTWPVLHTTATFSLTRLVSITCFNECRDTKRVMFLLDYGLFSSIGMYQAYRVPLLFFRSITHVLPFQLGLHIVDRCNNSSVRRSELITHRQECMTHLIPRVKMETGNVSLGKSFISAVCKSCSILPVRTA